MNFELATKQVSLGYLVAREKWNNERCLFLAKGHFCELNRSNAPTFQKVKLTSEDVQANDWVSVKLLRKGKTRVLENGYGSWESVAFTKILAKSVPIAF